jgi:hypothetical protein
MQLSLLLLSAGVLSPLASAFQSPSSPPASTALNIQKVVLKDSRGNFLKQKSVPVASEFADPDFAYGLPGRLAPMGNFDPAGFARGKDKNTVYRYREAELSHGRISMLAFVGFLVGEKVEGSTFLFE